MSTDLPPSTGVVAPPELAVTLASIRAAAVTIGPHVRRTPVDTCSFIDRLAGRTVYFKCELFQKSGSFKARGACNAVLCLEEAAASKGVATHSSGNFAQALAVAAACRAVPAFVVMPSNAPAVKRQAVVDYGGRVIDCAPTLAAREAAVERVCADTGATFVHPSNDPAVISGQGTIALELLEQVGAMAPVPAGSPPLDAVIVPIGGGGLCGGIAVAIKALWPSIIVVAAEPANADDAFRSKQAGEILGHRSGQPDTVADGLRTCLGSNTFPIVQHCVDAVVCVSEDAIRGAVRLIWERMKLCIEPSAGVGVAALLSPDIAAVLGDAKRVGVILCGGNVDLASLPWVRPDGTEVPAPTLP